MGEIVTVRYLCIGCSLGCRLEVDEDREEHTIVEVRGFSCRRDREYAIQEHTAPQRMVTTTVAVDNARWPRLPVRTSRPVLKEKVLNICRTLCTVRVCAPVISGDIVVRNILNTRVDVITTCDMAQRASLQNIEV